MGSINTEAVRHGEVAASFGITSTKYNRALSSDPKVDPAEALQIRKAARNKFLHVQGELVPLARVAILHPFNPGTDMRGIINADWQADEADCAEIITPFGAEESPNDQADHIARLEKQPLDGIIIFQSGIPGAKAASLRTRFPLVFVDPTYDIPEGANRTVLAPDYTQGMREAIDALKAEGHRKISFLSDAGTIFQTRKEGSYLAGVEENGLKPDIVTDNRKRPEQSMYKRGQDLASYILSQKTVRPTALITASIPLAMGANRAIYESGGNISNDTPIVAIGDLQEARFLIPFARIIDGQSNVAVHLGCLKILETLSGEALADRLHNQWHETTFLYNAEQPVKLLSGRKKG